MSPGSYTMADLGRTLYLQVGNKRRDILLYSRQVSHVSLATQGIISSTATLLGLIEIQSMLRWWSGGMLKLTQLDVSAVHPAC